jgi:cell division protein FtsI/penicillin-binding protein 2
VRRLTAASVTLLVAGTATLTGCSADTPDAADAADRLAASLSAGHPEKVAFAGRSRQQVRAWWQDTTEDMGDSTLRVRVSGVKQNDEKGTATATLAYTWELAHDAGRWTYRSTVRMTRPGSRWVVQPDPALAAPALRPGEVLVLDRVQAERGDIIGAHGVHLVTERPVMRFGIDKTRVGEKAQDDSARRLAELLGIDVKDFAARVAASGDQAFVEALVLRPQDIPTDVATDYKAIKGAVALPDRIPLAPTHEFARPILGTVGPVTAELLKESEGVYQPGDEAGLSGLEQRYDERLRGTPGVTVLAVDPDSGEQRSLFEVKPEPGRALRTTLDVHLQSLAERLLATQRPASALVAVRPSDGAVVAAASGPGSEGYSTATLGRYAPGSTFKVVTSLALLRNGLRPDSPVSCPTSVVVDGKLFENYDDYPASALGRIDLRTALAQSCNTAFIGQHRRVTQRDLAEAAAALGLGVDHDLGFPAFLGSVPTTATDTGHAASMIGQGQVLASPLAMAAVAASASAGHVVVPQLLPDHAASVDPPRPLTRDEAAQLRSMMRSVVTEGSGSGLSDLPGEVLAKTGTAEFGTSEPLQTHAWMIAAHGDLAVAVFVDVGESGSHTAGPILEEFLRRAG